MILHDTTIIYCKNTGCRIHKDDMGAARGLEGGYRFQIQ